MTGSRTRGVIALALLTALGGPVIGQCEDDLLLASNGQAEDWLGKSADVDGPFVVAGAYQDPTQGPGRAYVFEDLGAGVWIETELIPSDPVYLGYGSSVAVDDGVAVIGAPGELNDPTQDKVFIFRHDGVSWQEDAILLPPLGSMDLFGRRVALSGDVLVVSAVNYALFYRHNGTRWKLDGFHQGVLFDADDVDVDGDVIVVGHSFDNEVWVHRHDGSTWNVEAVLSASITGTYVAVSGDHILAANELAGTGVFGHVIPWHHDGTQWVEQPVLTPAVRDSFQFFGTEIRLDGDRAMIGSWLNSGESHVFRWDGTAWIEQAILGPGFQAGLDGSRVVLGYRLDDTLAPDAGAVRVLSLPDASWQNYGTGWPGTLGVPTLTLGDAPRLGHTVNVEILNSAGAPTRVIFFVGIAPACIPTGFGGKFLVQGLQSFPLQLPAGTVPLPFAVPSVCAFAGTSTFVQAIVFDAGASHGIAFTPGLEIGLGY